MIWDFINLVWKNQRKRIRNLGESSLWFQVLFALNKIFQTRAELFGWIYNQIWLETSSEFGLDAWGKRFKIPRQANEDDSSYKTRILFYKTNRQTGLSRKQKSIYLESLLNLASGTIQIYNIQNVSMRIGSPIGSPIAKRSLEVYGYIVKINRELTDSKRALLVSFIENVNIGGNYPIFAELKPFIPIFKMVGRIGHQVISKNATPRRIYEYY
ncbi:MAG: hypothetical protein N3A69_14510 [Leptospiraceae bacterium]|nr:hypothetical protein [Leptospiraceae bacterium]